MARGPERAILEADTRHDPASSRWRFVIIGAGRRVMYESAPAYESPDEAKAAARDWMTQTLLR